tara:strand:- start:1049 stop:1660 length:612 start_codon:yes stop_codon:yes gene_type:complete
MAFKLPDLNYGYSDLEPFIDAKTMEIHHSKHHAGYTNNLNNAIEGTNFEEMGIIDLLRSMDMNNPTLRNNGGGFYNHSLFWSIIGPNKGGSPVGDLLNEINKCFGSFDSFKELFSKSAASRFGSGWAWLCVKNGGVLEVCSTANQDNPLMPSIGSGGTPILGIDVWEHAYYLNYQNRRPEYISAFFKIIDWESVDKIYKEVTG